MCAQSIETFEQNFSQLKKNHLFLKQAPNAPTSIKPAIQLGPYFQPFFMEQITFSTQDIFVKVICLYCIKGQGFCMFSTVGTRTVHRGGECSEASVVMKRW